MAIIPNISQNRQASLSSTLLYRICFFQLAHTPSEKYGAWQQLSNPLVG